MRPLSGRFSTCSALIVLPRFDCGHVDERRFAGDRHRFLKSGRRHLQVDDGLLPDLYLQARPLQRGEARQVQSNAIRADAHGQPVAAGAVGHGFETVAARFVHGGDDDAGQHAARAIGDDSRDYRFLRVDERGKQEDHDSQDQPPQNRRTHHLLPPESG